MSLVLPLGTVASSLSGQFATVFIFVLVGFVFAGIALGVAKIIFAMRSSCLDGEVISVGSP